MGCGCLGRLLELGPQGNVGADRLAELRRLAAHAPYERSARHGVGLVGAGGSGRHHFRLSGGEYVPLGFAQLRRAVSPAQAGSKAHPLAAPFFTTRVWAYSAA